MGDIFTTPFHTAEDVWFWFIHANQARLDGAKLTKMAGGVPRPCEPSDIMKIMERLHRHRRLDMNHFRVMKYYGVRMIAPDPYKKREARAFVLWREAMDILADVFETKGIIYPRPSANILPFTREMVGV